MHILRSMVSGWEGGFYARDFSIPSLQVVSAMLPTPDARGRFQPKPPAWQQRPVLPGLGPVLFALSSNAC